MKRIGSAVWRYFRQADCTLLALTLLASAYGFMLVMSATHSAHSKMTTQVVGIVIGLIGMFVISKLDYHDIAGLWKYIAVAGIILLLLPYIHPHMVKGSEDLSWIDLGFTTIQPSEIVKILFVITWSKHYDMVKEDVHSFRTVALLALHALVPIGIIVVQKDMGMALVFALIFLSMLFAANVQLRYFVGAGVLGLISAPLAWKKIGATQKNRIMALFDPNSYPVTAQQQQQAQKAIGSGGMWGYGLFHGPKTQSALSSGLLPERQNDMIFAVAGEELGFIGCLAIFVLVLLLLGRILSDSRRAKDSMGAMMCLGIFSCFAVQAVINLGMALMLLPVIGISLPFFSSGGSSIVSSFWAIGLVMSVYLHRKTSLFAPESD